MKFGRATLLGAVLVGLCPVTLQRCDNNAAALVQPLIQPVLEQVSIENLGKAIIPTEAHDLLLASGTVLHIPSDAFVHADGTPVQEPVKVDFEEFMTAGEIMASGIPMDYDSAGKNHQLISAGMFNIQANAESGQEVFLAEGKSITVDLRTSNGKPGYNFYRLDEEAGNWEYLQAATGNAAPQEVVAAVDETPDFVLRPLDRSAPVLDLDPDLEKFPELEAFHGVMWQHAGGPNSLEENGWIYNESWDEVELESFDFNRSLYKVELRNKRKTFSTVLQPVLPEENYAEAQAQFRAKQGRQFQNLSSMTDWEKQNPEAAARNRLAAQFTRTISVAQFGIYNWDKIYQSPNRVMVMADFDFGPEYAGEKSEAVVFVVNSANNGVTRFDPPSWNRLSLSLDEPIQLVAILPENRMARLSNQALKKLKLSPEDANKAVSFSMQMLDRPLNSIEDLDQILATAN